MSAEFIWLSDTIPEGKGLALDLGGGRGGLRSLLERKGWCYVNVDLCPGRNGLAVCADAHCLPFRDGAFGLIVAKDALEHFENPWQAMEKIRRVLTDGGTLVIWVPFMWPFHGDDFYRYTPLAFERFLKGFAIVRFDTPLWVFSVLGLVFGELIKRIGLGFLERYIREVAWRLDRLLQPKRPKPRSFAGAYLIIARKGTPE
jgi:SAM-dependent methyltransferase